MVDSPSRFAQTQAAATPFPGWLIYRGCHFRPRFCSCDDALRPNRCHADSAAGLEDLAAGDEITSSPSTTKGIKRSVEEAPPDCLTVKGLGLHPSSNTPSPTTPIRYPTHRLYPTLASAHRDWVHHQHPTTNNKHAPKGMAADSFAAHTPPPAATKLRLDPLALPPEMSLAARSSAYTPRIFGLVLSQTLRSVGTIDCPAFVTIVMARLTHNTNPDTNADLRVVFKLFDKDGNMLSPTCATIFGTNCTSTSSFSSPALSCPRVPESTFFCW
ncbi:hypothetical protein D9619_011953 [Psilocybe cf. subviscida]|uniref:Uncharacterized protein n=1 Tax=Psilocybe cf. subviscida TaxID=2480587 RepID=A0A8H5EWF2_9AGAR|nr:hypothetical protein D9619_011953 [Psilocybe cf. subviscida]